MSATALGSTLTAQQTFTVTSTGGGAFTLNFNGAITAALAYSGTTAPTAAAVQAALNALPVPYNAGGPITVSASTSGANTTYTLTFGGALAGFAQNLVVLALTAPVTQVTAPATTVAGTGGTTVASGAALQILGSGLTINEALTLSGVGFNNIPTGALRLLDDQVGVTDTAVLTAGVVLGANAAVGVDGGGPNPDTLTLGGAGGAGNVTGAFALTKVGAGVLELSGTSSNTFSGGAFVNAGVLLLNKADTAGRLFEPNAVGTGVVTVGDEIGGADADVLRYGPSAGVDQISGVSYVTVATSGLLDLATNGKSDFINGLTVEAGRLSSADVETGAGSLDLSNDVIANAFGVPTSSAPAAVIGGSLVMVGGSLDNVNLQPQFIVNAGANLTVPAVISELQAAGGFMPGLKEGRLPGAGTYTGANPATAAAYPAHGRDVCQRHRRRDAVECDRDVGLHRPVLRRGRDRFLRHGHRRRRLPEHRRHDLHQLHEQHHGGVRRPQHRHGAEQRRLAQHRPARGEQRGRRRRRGAERLDQRHERRRRQRLRLRHRLQWRNGPHR